MFVSLGYTNIPFGDSSLRTFSKKRYRYVGREKDLESDLYYYGARYYCAWTCRFISIDPLAADYTYLTPYCYAGNKPIISVDENGMNGGENDPDPPAAKGGGNISGNDNNVSSSPSSDIEVAGVIPGSRREDGSYTFKDPKGETHRVQGVRSDNFVSREDGAVISFKTEKLEFYTWDDETGGYSDNSHPISYKEQKDSSTNKSSQQNNSDGWYSSLGKYNWYFSATGTTISNIPGSFRLRTSKQGFSPKYHANAWKGNQYATTYNIGKIGRMAGRLSLGVGVVSDGIGVFNYYQNPNSPNGVHPGKAGVNTGVGIWGLTGVGTIPAIVYFAAESFYPGGAEALFNDSGKWHDDTKRILGPSWRPIPFGGK